MEILNGSINKILHNKKRDTFLYDSEKPCDTLFRRSNVSFYDDLHTEAVFLLDKGSQQINFKLIDGDCVLYSGGKKTQHRKKKQEFEKINAVINSIDYLDSFKHKVHNNAFEKIVEPLGACVQNGKQQNERDKSSESVYKEKFNMLKKEYDDLKENMDTRINLELIKANLFI
ncbi:myosin light chain B, putative [Plasmodium malariae]|uniref:Myosin light chain B, putative n=1 Tax=Plasmodium malariae TaxID=5858 RepID=A0A1A8X955_PLAMA|nr:myosin light chain B, putative [Plasmodium malariae]